MLAAVQLPTYGMHFRWETSRGKPHSERCMEYTKRN